MEPGSNRTHEWPAGQNGRDCIQRSDWPRSVQKGCLSGTLQGRREVISFFPHNEVSREGTMLQTHCFLGVLGHLDFSLAEGGSAVPGSGHSHLSIPQGQSVKLDPQTLSVGPKDRSVSALVLPGDADLPSTKPWEEEGPLGSEKEAEGLQVPSHPIPRGKLKRKKRKDQKLLPVWSQFPPLAT